MNDFTAKVLGNIDVSNEDIDDMMVSALEGGITYWCYKAEVVGEYLGEYASEQISRGGVLKLYDIEDDGMYFLDKRSFLRGLTQYINVSSNPNELLLPGEEEDTFVVDVGNIDSYAADQIVQYAVFGEIVYA